MNVWAKALAGEWLPPAARAGLKLIEGILASALVAAFIAIYPLVMSGDVFNVDWHSVIRAFVTAFCATFLLAIKKYVSAHSDTTSPVAPLTLPVNEAGPAPSSAT